MTLIFGRESGVTEAQVLLQHEEADAARAAAGVPGIHTVSPASFMAAGLEVEEEQYMIFLLGGSWTRAH